MNWGIWIIKGIKILSGSTKRKYDPPTLWTQHVQIIHIYYFSPSPQNNINEYCFYMIILPNGFHMIETNNIIEQETNCSLSLRSEHSSQSPPHTIKTSMLKCGALTKHIIVDTLLAIHSLAQNDYMAKLMDSWTSTDFKYNSKAMLNKIFSRDHRRVDCDNIVSSIMRTKPIGKTQSVATHINPIFLLMEMICNRQKGNKFATPMTNIKSIEFISCPFSEHKYEKSLLQWNHFWYR